MESKFQKTREFYRKYAVPILDGLVNLAARIVVIIAMLAVGIGVWQLAFYSQEPEYTRAAKVFDILHSNWRALIVVAVLLFYPAIRRFLEEMVAIPFLGFYRPPRPPVEDPGLQEED